MGSMSLLHWLILIVIVLLLFGPSKLPNLGKSLGQAIRGFKKGLEETPEEEADNNVHRRISESEDSKETKKSESTEKNKQS